MTKSSQIINKVLESMTPRQKEFLLGRFGIKDGEKKTLQKLGDQYGITRERVRQIETEGLKIAREKFKKSDGPELIEITKNHLKILGGARRDDYLVEDLKKLLKEQSLNKNQLRFLFEIANSPAYQVENDDFYGFWYLDKQTIKKIENFIQKAVKIFEDKKEELLFGGQANAVFAKASAAGGVDDFIGTNYLLLSKNFATNPYNNIGLSHWDEVSPKTSRAKAYLALKKYGKPLHFQELAKLINAQKFNQKQVYPQTIHNELIKDPRFVLVGRGIYGLKEQGYHPGTAKEVLRKILKTKGPMSTEGIIKEAAKQRMLRENTILINLHNKKYFKKLPDGRYQAV